MFFLHLAIFNKCQPKKRNFIPYQVQLINECGKYLKIYRKFDLSNYWKNIYFLKKNLEIELSSALDNILASI